jgi:YD repeat-containing protein
MTKQPVLREHRRRLRFGASKMSSVQGANLSISLGQLRSWAFGFFLSGIALVGSPLFAQTCHHPGTYDPVKIGWSNVFGVLFQTAAAACSSYNWSNVIWIPRGGEPTTGNFVWCDGYFDGNPDAMYPWGPYPASRQFSCPYGGFFIPNPACTCYGGEAFIHGRCQPVNEYGCSAPSPDGNGGGNGCGMSAGNPIHVGTGNKSETVSIGITGPVKIELHYNSGISYFGLPYTSLTRGAGRSGPGWTTVFDQHLVLRTDAILAVRADNQRRFFSSGTFIPQIGTNDRLTSASSATLPTAYKYFDQSAERVEEYDANGTLLQMSSRRGSSRLTYAKEGGSRYPSNAPACLPPAALQPPLTLPTPNKLACATSERGRQTFFEYDGTGRLARLVLESGSAIVFGYDEPSSFVLTGQPLSNNLTSIRFPDGTRKLFHYNEQDSISGQNLPNALTGISVESAGISSRFSTYKYDAAGRGFVSEHAGGVNRNHLTFQQPFSQTVVTEALGSQRSVQMTSIAGLLRPLSQSQPGGSGCGPASSSMAYDAQANLTSRTDFNGSKTCYAYDLSRNLETKRVEGLSSSADCTFGLSSPPAGARLISTQWHPDWRLETKIAEPKKLTTIVYNGQGATCAPDTVLVDGKPPAVVCSRTEQASTDESGAAGFAAAVTGVARTWSYTYTTYGRVSTATDPNGAVTSYAYHPDNDANLGRRGNVATITNAVGHVTRITAYNAHGQPTRIIDPNNLITDLTYDLRMRLTRRKVGNETTSFVYDAAGQLTRVTLPDGARLTYTYDAAHRLTAIADHKGNKVAYTLDAMGNRINEKLTDPGGVLVRNVQRSIDALNRVQQVTGAVH